MMITYLLPFSVGNGDDEVEEETTIGPGSIPHGDINSERDGPDGNRTGRVSVENGEGGGRAHLPLRESAFVGVSLSPAPPPPLSAPESNGECDRHPRARNFSLYQVIKTPSLTMECGLSPARSLSVNLPGGEVSPAGNLRGDRILEVICLMTPGKGVGLVSPLTWVAPINLPTASDLRGRALHEGKKAFAFPPLLPISAWAKRKLDILPSLLPSPFHPHFLGEEGSEYPFFLPFPTLPASQMCGKRAPFSIAHSPPSPRSISPPSIS